MGKTELINMIADTWNGKMWRDKHAFVGNNTVFYFRNAIQDALAAVSLPTEQSTSGPPLDVLAHALHNSNDAAALRLELAQMRRDLERAVLEIDDLRNALEAQSRTVARMRAALEEAEEELGGGELLHALAAIGRGLNEGRT